MIVKPEDVGLSSQRLQRISTHLQKRYIDTGKFAGTLTLVARHGQIAYFEPQGHLEFERHRPMQRDTVFRIYSMSKPITSVALMMLYEQGLFQLDDPVHTFIPAWKDLQVYRTGTYPNFVGVPPVRPMTVRDLLTHTAGLTYGFTARSNVDAAYRKLGVADRSKAGNTLQAMVDTLAELPLEFSPGTRWNYSAATDVLGHLVEVITGQRFDQYLHDHIFQPLGMVDTGFTVAEAQLPRFACNYLRQPGGSIQLIDSPDNSEYRQQTLFSGGGGLLASTADYFRFTRMLLNGGELDGVRLLGRKTIELMTMNHLPGGQDLTQMALPGGFSETAYAGVGFGLGFSVMLDPARTQIVGSVGEYAWGGAASTAFWIDPVEDMIVIFMTQLMPSSSYPVRRELRALTYAALID
jgi:CubicO group peptidase (beta-lactamase class C family)